MRDLVLPLDGRGERFVSLEQGEESILSSDDGDWRVLVKDRPIGAWVRKRLMGSGTERLLYGYPLVIGEKDDRAVAAPLFYAEVEARTKNDQVEARPGSAVIETSLFALEMLGVDRLERTDVIEHIENLEGPPNAAGRLMARIAELQELGVIAADQATRLDPASLDSAQAHGLSNAALLFYGERAIMTRQLLADLEEMVQADARDLRRGPLGVLLGSESASLPPPPKPQPSILPTNLSQDRAITASQEQPFTVVTGPPGTGKSQVLVNAVAAAIERGATVLFASKNNKAVDVVFERLAKVSPEAAPLRTGAARLRGATAQVIRSTLGRSTAMSTSVDRARREWAEMAAELDPLYRVELERVQIERELAAEEATYASLTSDVRPALLLIDDPAGIDPLVRRLERAEAQARAPLGWTLFRKRKQESRQRELEEAWINIRAVLPPPLRDELPSNVSSADLSASLAGLRLACDIACQQAKVESARNRLADLTSRWDIQERIREREPERLRAGRRLFEALWKSKLRDPGDHVRAKASAYADGLERLAQGMGGSAGKLSDLVREILLLFPVWGVTNLSARTNLPLTEGLFDLVVIDEASQCDIPSALPLLHRAKRALIIGDRNQLIHVSTLASQQDERLARKHGLSDEDALSMGYRLTSLFGAAARRVNEDPIFLEEHYRSHRAIITFSNDQFYGSRLIVLTEEAEAAEGPPVRWVDVQGSFRRGPRGSSVLNEAEVAAVIECVRDLAAFADPSSIGVVTPYRAQVEAIRGGLQSDVQGTGMTVDTAHRFQGDERDVIVLSPTVSAAMPPQFKRFANNPNLVNVGVTRARRQLIIVGDREACRSVGEALGHLATYVTDLEEGQFESPLERRLFEGLAEQGIRCEVGLKAEDYRLDLAVLEEGLKLDIECDGAAFHTDRRQDAISGTGSCRKLAGRS